MSPAIQAEHVGEQPGSEADVLPVTVVVVTLVDAHPVTVVVLHEVVVLAETE